MNIQEFRQKYPQYSDLDDQTLADKFYAKYYSDIPKDEFNAKFLGAQARTKVIPRSIPQRIAGFAAPALPVAGALAGGVLAAPTGPVGAIGGAALGYAGGRQLENVSNAYAQGQKPPTLAQQAQAVPSDVMAGALAEEGGAALSKVAPYIAKGVGSVVKPVLGSLSGVGKGAIEEAVASGKKLTGNILRSQTSFDKALRGEISGEEAVDMAKAALTEIKNKRSADYLKVFEDMSGGSQAPEKKIDPTDIQNKVAEALPKYVQVDSNGRIDWSRSALGSEKSEGVKKIKDMVSILKNWGTKPGDQTLKGVDMLKRQLDDFYSDSSNARSFVATIRNAVKDVLVKNYPTYEKATKGYADATNVIKDIESGLMMRKQGMTGRVVADQTLRRLVSAMRQNFPLRRELVNMLGKESGQDVAGLIAGHSMSEVAPRGIAGSGPALTLESMGAMLHPQFLPLLASSSPRLQGEFLRLFGKGMVETGKLAPTALKAAAYAAMQGKHPQMPDIARSAAAAEPTGKPGLSAAKRGIEFYTANNWDDAIREWRTALKEEPGRAKEIIGWINRAKLEQQKYKEFKDREKNKERDAENEMRKYMRTGSQYARQF